MLSGIVPSFLIFTQTNYLNLKMPNDRFEYSITGQILQRHGETLVLAHERELSTKPLDNCVCNFHISAIHLLFYP